MQFSLTRAAGVLRVTRDFPFRFPDGLDPYPGSIGASETWFVDIDRVDDLQQIAKVVLCPLIVDFSSPTPNIEIDDLRRTALLED